MKLASEGTNITVSSISVKLKQGKSSINFDNTNFSPTLLAIVKYFADNIPDYSDQLLEILFFSPK